MKESSFEKTPEFAHFKEVMRGVLAVPKKRLDELIAEERMSTSKRKSISAISKPQKSKK